MDLPHMDMIDGSEVERAFLAALKANIERPPLLPLESEDELDAYVCGFEQAARCIAGEFGRQDLVDYWMIGEK